MEEYNTDNAVIREAIHKAEKTKKEKIEKIKTSFHRLSTELKGKVSKPLTEYEKELYELRFQNFSSNLYQLTSKNPYDFKVEEKQNIFAELNFVYNHNPIVREGYKEEIKKQIALRRHQSVIAETNIKRAKKEKADYELMQKLDDEYALNVDEETSTIIAKYNAIYPIQKSLKDVYQEIEASFADYQKEQTEYIANLIATHQDLIQEYYNKKLMIEARNAAYEAGIVLLNKRKEIADLEVKKAELEEEVYVFTVSIEQKIDATTKLNLCQEELNQVNQQIAALEEEAKVLNQKYVEANEHIAQIKAQNEAELKQKVEEKTEDATFDQQIRNLLLKSNNLFADLLQLFSSNIKKKFISFADFKKQKLAEHKEKEAVYRKEKAATAQSEEEKRAYTLSIEAYLATLTVNYAQDNAEKIEALKVELAKKLEEAKKNYEADVALVYEKKAQRRKTYQDKKAETKLKLQNSDANTASELKDILKIFKEDVNAGVKQSLAKLKKNYNAEVKKIHYEYNLVLSELTCPKTKSLHMQYAKEKKDLLTSLKKENRYEAAKLNKDVKLSKYRRNMTKTKRESILGYTFLSIWAIGFLFFTLFPIFYSIIISLSNIESDVNGYSTVISFSGKLFPNFVGFDNYTSIFLRDVNFLYQYLPTFLRSLILFTPIVLFISFVIAILLNQKIVGRTFFRIIYFLPVVIVSGPLLNMLNNTNSSGGSSIRLSLEGSFVYSLLLVAGDKVADYANFVFQNFVIILWMTGVPIVLFINGLQKIDRSLYEAAEIDGANKWQSLWTVTYPLIKSVALISSLFIILQVTTIDIGWINPIRTAISGAMSSSSANFGIIAAMGWVQAIFVILAVLLAFLIFKERVYHDNQKSYEEIEALKEKKAIRKEKMNKIFHVNEIKSFLAKLKPTKKMKQEKVEGGKAQ